MIPTRDAVSGKAYMSPVPAENRVHYPALDGLRAVALAMVFCQHYLRMPWGYTGVDLFFVLSGFLITGILYDTMDRPDRVRSFFVRRVLRIFPLYYGLLLGLLVLTPVLHVHWNRYWLAWAAYLGNFLRFLHPYSQDRTYADAANGWLTFGPRTWTLYLGHLWSLCIEEQFYLVWPWVVFWVRDRRSLLWICGVIAVAMPFVRVITMALLPRQYTMLDLPYSFTPLRVDVLLMGGWLALMIRGAHREAVLRAGRLLLWGALPLVVLYLAHTIQLGQPYVYPAGHITWGRSVVDVLYTGVIAAALVPGSLVYRIGCLRGMRRLGQVSYGAYVFHDIPHALFALAVHRLGSRFPLVLGHTEAAVAMLGLGTTLPLAFLSYRFFERPFLRLKERWAPSR